jgi:O-acetylserine/cysteine efflux transporter
MHVAANSNRPQPMTENATNSTALSSIEISARAISMGSFGAMLLLAIMWGLSIPITKLGLETVPPLTLTAMRFLVAVPLLLVLSARQLRLPWQALPSIIALGVMGITFGNVAQSFGVQGTSASVGTIISATIPIFIVIFAAIRLKQHVASRHWVGLFAAFVGIALVAVGSGPGVDDLSETTVAGVAWMLVSAVAIAFYFIWSAELTVKFGLLAVTTWNSLAGLVAILPLAGWEMAHAPVQITTQAIWAIIYLGSMVSVAGLLLWLFILRAVPARVAASLQYLQPVFGVAAASVLFGDQLGLIFATGVALILGGLALAAFNKRSPPEVAVAHN